MNKPLEKDIDKNLVSPEMRVLQLIDSLEAGGAERVAVSYANGLLNHVGASYLCTTRKEGLLKENLSKDVGYLFLKKTKTLDLKAVNVLSRFLKRNKISTIHAHGSSFFIAVMIKILNPKIKLIWHDHYGNRVNSGFLHTVVLQICSLFFSSILVVSADLEQWAKKRLWNNSITYIQNYPQLDTTKKVTVLKGVAQKRIICLANLREDKNHPFLIEAFSQLLKFYPDWTLHLVGQNHNDQYAINLKNLIGDLKLGNNVFMYGSCPDILNILSQAQIGILSSKSEGLPLALLEYGLQGLATITTDVGQCSKVITNHVNGIVIESNDKDALCDAIKLYIENKDVRASYSQHLRNHILQVYSETSTLNHVVTIYNR